MRFWEGAFGGPVSQETSADLKPQALVERGGSLMQHRFIAVGTVLVAGLAAAPALAAASGPQVSVRVEGLSSTLLSAKTVTVPSVGSVTQDHIAAGLCPTDSGQGALTVATRGDWKGTWYASYKDYDITSILGDTPNAKQDYYEIFVNDVPASVGACEITLKPGDKLLFAVVPDKGKAQRPLALSTTVTGTKVTAKVVGYSAKGVPSPLRGATVKLGRITLATSANGTVSFVAPTRRTALVASAPGYIRDETTVAPTTA
jgi:hypothetical protein